jgi:transcriptional regulator with XRE-family HTH domain
MDEFTARLTEQIGRRIRRRRRAIDMSQGDLAIRASVSRSEIGQIENAVRMPMTDTLIRLAGGLVLSPGQLLAGIEWEVREVWLPARLVEFEEGRPDD